MPDPTLPNLATLSTTPSWVNRAGRVDRSGCLELRAGEVWRWVPSEDWRRARTFARRATSPDWRWGSAKPNPDARVARELTAPFIVAARFLFELHDRRWPHLLVGDMRTTKSNVMRVEGKTGVRQFENPNRGALRTKILGLDIDWRQTITVERWRLHERLSCHYLLCPRCGAKKAKLFMVLCTETEIDDATLAHAWLARRDTVAGNQPGTAAEAELIARYGLLFPPRTLLCRACLGLRYGEVKWADDE